MSIRGGYRQVGEIAKAVQGKPGTGGNVADNPWLSLLGREEETDSDNRAFLFLIMEPCCCVSRGKTGEGDTGFSKTSRTRVSFSLTSSVILNLQESAYEQ
jgi:hypothetical protein